MSEVCLTAHHHDNSGTGDSVTIGFYEATGDLYTCVPPNGVGTNETECCTPTSQGPTPARIELTFSYLGFVAYYTNSNNADGLRISAMSATVNNGSGWVTHSAGSFTDLIDSNQVVCEGCVAGTFCDSCWIDGSGHDNCSGLTISLSGYEQQGSNAAYCITP